MENSTINSMLPDQHRREVLYALEYAMLAILDRCPFPAPPPTTRSEIKQLLRDLKDNIVRPIPIPVPQDWKPSLKLPQMMLETQPFFKLQLQVLQLQDLINRTRRSYNNKAYISMAYNYLSNANIYLNWAHSEKMKIREEQSRARCERLRAESERFRADSIRMAEELKVRAERHKPIIEQLRAYYPKIYNGKDKNC